MMNGAPILEAERSEAENERTQNFGRELVFSAELCYNGIGDENG